MCAFVKPLEGKWATNVIADIIEEDKVLFLMLVSLCAGTRWSFQGKKMSQRLRKEQKQHQLYFNSALRFTTSLFLPKYITFQSANVGDQPI